MFSGIFEPGSIPEHKVPIDPITGNVTSEFLQWILTPSAVVDTNLFDPSHASKLSKFARIGLRCMAHDAYDDGKLNGLCILRTLLAPHQGSNATFTENVSITDMVKKWGQLDMEDDGKLNGSVFFTLLERVWPIIHSPSCYPQPRWNMNNYIWNSSLLLNIRPEEIFRHTPDVMTQSGLEQVCMGFGVSSRHLLAWSLWGHRLIQGQTILSLLQDAHANSHSIDFALCHLCNETKEWTQRCLESANELEVEQEVVRLVLEFLNQRFFSSSAADPSVVSKPFASRIV